VDKFVAMVDITQANLFGTGRYLRARENWRQYNKFRAVVQGPWFMDKPLSFSVDAYMMRRDYPDYEKRR